ncbi:GntR family transcriptional regulator [Pseudonocardia sp. H11422]|uniref:GntR family transcriptional regulator n=1 Tax=Pseudonocardia sp. H11422 TaxID=2835866 RepID=UPI001BDC0DFA|nr:GntR family transcriptional regulator [Pseudonocardia sp. H11422]
MSAQHESGTAVDRSARALRELIRDGRLGPGEQIRQQEMAEQLSVSRAPLREALKVLETEGVLSHSPNRGYFVTRLSADDLHQIYMMRELLESALLQSIKWPSRVTLRAITKTNDLMKKAIDAGDLAAIVARNREFHYQIFELSPFDLIRKEVERLWSVSEPYRAVYLYDQRARERVLRDHQMVLEALERRDPSKLVEVSDQHRRGLEEHLSGFLAAHTGVSTTKGDS